MHSQITFFALAALFATAFAVEIGTSGIKWAPGEQCSTECTLKMLSATTCDLNTANFQQCACAVPTFLTDLDACIKADCPEFYDQLSPEVKTSCDDVTPSPDGFTGTDSCTFYCSIVALEASSCPIVSTDGDTCACGDAAYLSATETCAHNFCPSVADAIVADTCVEGTVSISSSLTGSATGSSTRTDAGSATGTNTITSTPSGSVTGTGTSSVPASSSTPPPGAGFQSSANMAAVAGALLAAIAFA